MSAMKVTIDSVEVLKRDVTVTQVRVKCKVVGASYVYSAITDIESGEGLPNVNLEDFSTSPSEEFVIALHEALGEHPVTQKEIRRINENYSLVS